MEAARHDSKLAQVLYHDWEAESYDDKWSISYDKRCVDYARDLFDATVPEEEQRELPYDRALELGCGSGFFLLNLIQAGVARRGSVTDLSPGMVKVATRNGENLGLDIDGRVADAEGIPYDDDTFDLVVGHAVLHHIPDVELSLREVVRVLKPGGRFVFAGEPTQRGRNLRAPVVDADLAGGHERDQAAGARAAGGARRPNSTSRRAPLRWRRSSTCTPSSPSDLERMARNAGAVDVSTATRSSPPRCWAGRCAPSRPRCRPADWVGAGRSSRSTAGSTLSWVDANVWRRVVPEGLVLQRDGHRGQAVARLSASTTSPIWQRRRGGRRCARSPATR